MVGGLDDLPPQLRRDAGRPGRSRSGRSRIAPERIPDHMRTTALPVFALAAAATLGACERTGTTDEAHAVARGAVAQAPTAASRGGAVDSALAADELLRRFRADIDAVPTRLEGGETSRDALVRRFAAAVQRRDTSELRAMHLSRAEFAYLYFPSNAVARAPYELDPALLWFRLAGETEKGVARLLDRHGGAGFRLVAHECAADAEIQGANRLWGPCVTRFATAAGDTLALRLFGSIVERDGRFKFVSYFNKL